MLCKICERSLPSLWLWADLTFSFTFSCLPVVLGRLSDHGFANKHRKSLGTCCMFWVTLRILFLVFSMLCQIKIKRYISPHFNCRMRRICWRKISSYGAIALQSTASVKVQRKCSVLLCARCMEEWTLYSVMSDLRMNELVLFNESVSIHVLNSQVICMKYELV